MINKILKTVVFILLAIAALYCARIVILTVLEVFRWVWDSLGANMSPEQINQNDILDFFQ